MTRTYSLNDERTLALKMSAAADVLEEVARKYGYPTPAAARWSAEELRREADVMACPACQGEQGKGDQANGHTNLVR